MKNYIGLFVVLVIVLSASCQTYQQKDFTSFSSTGEGSTQKPTAKASPKPGAVEIQVDETPEPITYAPEIVEHTTIIEKPIYIPRESGTPTPPPVSGVGAVKESIKAGVQTPQDYTGAVMWYDYDQSIVYEIYTQPQMITDIFLQPGEKLAEQPKCGDVAKWIFDGGVSYEGGKEVQHIYVQPTKAGLVTNMKINTDRRVYHIILRSFTADYMTAVRFRYYGSDSIGAKKPASADGTGVASNTGDSLGTIQIGGNTAAISGAALGDNKATLVNLSTASFDYMMKYPKGVETWTPEMIMDDGRKTYIFFKPEIVSFAMPAIFGNGGEMINYRVKDNVVEIDGLYSTLELKLNKKAIFINKKVVVK